MVDFLIKTMLLLEGINLFYAYKCHLLYLYCMLAKSKILPNQQNQQKEAEELNKIIKKANRQLLQYRTQAAIKLFQQAIENYHPQKQHAICGWGSVADQKGYYEKSIIVWYKQSQKRSVLRISAYDRLALCYTINKNFKQAQRYYRAMSQKYPLNFAFIYGLANILFNSGHFNQAKQQYSCLLASNQCPGSARRQLILLNFYEDNIQVVKRLMHDLNEQQRADRTMLLIDALTVQAHDLRLTKLNQIILNYNDYCRPFVFLAEVLMATGQQKEAVECYIKCISLDKKYCIPYIQLAKIYCERNQVVKAIKLLQEGRVYIWDDDWFMNVFLAFLYLKVKKYELAQKCTMDLFQSFNNKNLCLSERVCAFLKSQVTKIKKIIEVYQMSDRQSIFKVQQMKKLYLQMMALHSVKQEHLNIRINKIIQNDNRLVSVIQQSVEIGFEPTLKILKEATQLSIGRQHYQQFVAILINKYILKRIVEKQDKWGQINKKISNELLQFYEFIKKTGSKQEIKENIILEQNKKIYITQYVAKKYNMLNQHQFFNNYEHLFIVFKKFSKSVKSSQEKLEALTLALYSQLNIIEHHISSRLDSQNLQISILEVALQLFPELTSKKEEIFQKIGILVSQSKQQRQLTLNQLTEIMIKLLKVYIQKFLKERQSKKQTITCFITNWVEVWYSFTSQKSVISAMELIKKNCSERKYQIHQYEGELHSNNKKQIIMKIKIDIVCSTIHLVYVEQQKYVTLLNYLQKFINYKGGEAVGLLLYLNRKFKEPITEYLQEIIIELSEENTKNVNQGYNSKKVSAIKQFIKNIQISLEKQGSSVLQKSFYKSSSAIRQISRIQRSSNYKVNKMSESTILNLNQTPNLVDLPATSRTTNERKSSYENCEKFENIIEELNKTQNNIDMKRSLVKTKQQKNLSLGQQVKELDQLESVKQSRAIAQEFEKDITISEIREKSLAICPSAVDLFVGINQNITQNLKYNNLVQQKEDLLIKNIELEQKLEKIQIIQRQARQKIQQISKQKIDMENILKIKDIQMKANIEETNRLKIENNQNRLRIEWFLKNRVNDKQQKLQMNEEIRALIQSQIKQVCKNRDEMSSQVQRLIASNQQLGKKLLAYLLKQKQYQITKEQFLVREKDFQNKICQYQTQINVLNQNLQSYSIQKLKFVQRDNQNKLQIQKLKNYEINVKRQENYEEKYNFIIKQLRQLKKAIYQFRQKSVLDEKSNIILQKILQIQKESKENKKSTDKLIEALQENTQLQNKNLMQQQMNKALNATSSLAEQSIFNTQQSYEFQKRLFNQRKARKYQQVMIQTENQEEQLKDQSIQQQNDSSSIVQMQQQSKLQIFRLNKKIEYLKILFIILLFEAITLTFSIQIFK